VWQSYGSEIFSEAGTDWRILTRLLIFALASGVLIATLSTGLARRRNQ
jgi:hypothetical protein